MVGIRRRRTGWVEEEVTCGDRVQVRRDVPVLPFSLIAAVSVKVGTSIAVRTGMPSCSLIETSFLPFSLIASVSVKTGISIVEGSSTLSLSDTPISKVNLASNRLSPIGGISILKGLN